ncbi:MAG: P1 family peptidase [Raoultibacter sp.]
MDTLEQATLADLPDFCFGNASDVKAGTGCTVIVAPAGATAGVDVRGGAPATRETDLLKPENTVQEIHAITLAGGSAFGLDASCGVMEALEARKIGFELMGMHVPIVCGACLFDLPVGDSSVRPDAAMGRAACEAAFTQAAFEEGNCGAGTGATCGKMFGPAGTMKSGLGSSAMRFGDLVVGAVVAVNAMGCIHDRDGAPLAGALGADGKPTAGIPAFLQAAALMQAVQTEASPLTTNTTIGCIVTNARLTKAQATKIASITHDAYARTIMPVHSSNDGDAVFCMASATIDAEFDIVGVLACEAMQQAILRGVRQAKTAYGLLGLAG